MTVKELYEVSPQAFMYIVERDRDLNVTKRTEYKGSGPDGELTVSRVTPARYGTQRNVLEVETLPVSETEHVITVADLLKQEVDIDLCDNVTEELYIAFCGPVELTVEGYAEFAGALSLPVELHDDIAIVCVDGPEGIWQKRLAVAEHLFHAAAGYCATSDYKRWFTDGTEEV